ncbi:MAG: antitoxin family protein [Anaerolineae bacterium]|jgi:predicted DNA-binding antitoxin AbrB/MazE fold protein|nr:antitoxin family protein [Anaerolineae bacterium]
MNPPQKKLIRLVYENGVFRPIEPVDYEDGAEFMAEVLTERELEERLIEQLYEEGFLVRPPDSDNDDDFDEAAAMERIRKAFSGGKPLSEIVIEDREDRV